MSSTVFGAVILAALLHALWNALLKSEGDKYAGTAAIAFGSVPLATISLVLFGLPDAASWPYVAASAVIHTVYFLCLLNAYRVADFTQVYPIARGVAPVLTALFGAMLLGEVLSPLQSAAVVTIAVGVMSLVLAARGTRSMSGAGLVWALATGAAIATYSLNDGTGARLAGSSVSFYGASALLNVVLMAAVVAVLKPGAVTVALTRSPRALLLGGQISFVAYALVTWAFSQAPIATVSALREVSIVFAVLIGTFVLRERMNWRKIVSSFVTLAGVVLLRAAR